MRRLVPGSRFTWRADSGFFSYDLMGIIKAYGERYYIASQNTLTPPNPHDRPHGRRPASSIIPAFSVITPAVPACELVSSAALVMR